MGVGWVIREVMNHFGVGFGIVELLDILEAPSILDLGPSKFSSQCQLLEAVIDRCLPQEGFVRRIGAMGIEMTHVAKAFITNRANKLSTGIEPVTHSNEKLTLFSSSFNQEWATLHIAGRSKASQGEDGWCHIHKADKVIYHRTGLGRGKVLVFLGEANNQWHMGALFPNRVFTAWHSNTMIGPDDNDGIVPEAVFLESVEYFSGSIIDLCDGIIVSCPGTPKDGIVRMKARERSGRWIVKVT